MKAKIYRTKTGFDIVNSSGILFTVTSGKVKRVGQVSERWVSPGKLCKGIPRDVSKIFFELQKIKSINNVQP
jgi:hypothetical protein